MSELAPKQFVALEAQLHNPQHCHVFIDGTPIRHGKLPPNERMKMRRRYICWKAIRCDLRAWRRIAWRIISRDSVGKSKFALLEKSNA
jgi:hypothetical protein